MMRKFNGKTRMVTVSSSMLLGTITSMDLPLPVASTGMTLELRLNVALIGVFCSIKCQSAVGFLSIHHMVFSMWDSKMVVVVMVMEEGACTTTGILTPEVDGRSSEAQLLLECMGGRMAMSCCCTLW
jgi:hypothetical protein